ncbi:hypothetical protein WN51_14623 [Melipona quadrifasciata]|uniref:Uncharacterized protein n=1 Tax=Melipona quadrifasciata TaxID=166423 RepID=A0A0M8ZZA1_9HYME|nr:hypothetical protein WN51_14623 [Melipona quadrifasciata]
MDTFYFRASDCGLTPPELNYRSKSIQCNDSQVENPSMWPDRTTSRKNSFHLRKSRSPGNDSQNNLPPVRNNQHPRNTITTPNANLFSQPRLFNLREMRGGEKTPSRETDLKTSRDSPANKIASVSRDSGNSRWERGDPRNRYARRREPAKEGTFTPERQKYQVP